MEWNDDTIGRLRGLWDDGHSTAEIGRRLGVSKNAVVGKAHRLGLPARPSPIRKDPSGRRRPPPPKRVVGPTLPPLATALPPLPSAMPQACLSQGGLTPGNQTPRPASSAPIGTGAAASPAPALGVGVGVAPPAERPPLSLAAPSSGPSSGRLHACCWPLGEPGTRSFRFCDAEALPGKPYCGEHAQLAYVRVRDRQEVAA